MTHYTDKEELLDLLSNDENYKNKYLALIENHLNTGLNKTFLDLGCGHGYFTKYFSSKFKFSFGLEPYLKITTSNEDNLHFFKMDIFSFTEKVDILLGKEMIHHISDKKEFFNKLFDTINEKALFVTRPKHIDIPFNEKALKLFADSQPDLDTILKDIPKDKFHYRVSPYTLEITLQKSVFIKLIRSRFWSCFSSFTDLEIGNDIKRIENQFKDTDTITFKDNLLFIELLKKN